jgi:rSAM/selenodomain-associated transferase 1
MKYPDARLLIMSKAPVPGQVKTRLIPLLGAAPAAGLYAGLVRDCLAMSTAAGLCPVELWCSPSAGHPFFRRCHADFPVRLYSQSPGDLGQRMSRALQSALCRARHVMLIGADCPALTAADLEEALQLLVRGTDAVLGPATDGGYYLIGMNRAPRPGHTG